MRPALSWPLPRRCRISGPTSLIGVSAASTTVALSQASRAMRQACSLPSHSRSATKPASVCDNLATRIWRVATERSSRASVSPRTAARWPWRSTIRSIENGAMSASCFCSNAKQDSSVPTSAIAAATERGSAARLAIAVCTAGVPVATASTRSASTNSGESASTGAAMSGWSAASASTMAGGALGLAASASASARRTSGEGSSSSISIAPSAAPRSSGERSE